ncbi:hypothetical protein CR513_41682, partial [Mucuna pruriens]
MIVIQNIRNWQRGIASSHARQDDENSIMASCQISCAFHHRFNPSSPIQGITQKRGLPVDFALSCPVASLLENPLSLDDYHSLGFHLGYDQYEVVGTCNQPGWSVWFLNLARARSMGACMFGLCNPDTRKTKIQRLNREPNKEK